MRESSQRSANLQLHLGPRKNEGIAEAVTGYLSFVVAADGSDVRLTRTTREEFLRKLVFELKVNKVEFDQTKLVAFVKHIANMRDYDIDPI